MNYQYTADLSVLSIRKLEWALRDYQKQRADKVARALDILAQKGVTVAKQMADQSGTFGKAVVFEKTVPQIQGMQVSAIMRGVDLGIDMSWQQKDGTVKTERVNALMMLEFGSGRYADSGHRGTFNPESPHAFDPNGWYFKPVNSNQWVHSYGYKPKQPMLKAFLEMEKEVQSAFEEAYG